MRVKWGEMADSESANIHYCCQHTILCQTRFLSSKRKSREPCKCKLTIIYSMYLLTRLHVNYIYTIISCVTVGYREISVKIFFDFTLVPPVKIPMFMFLLPRLIARASQPDGNMTSFTLHFSLLS